jgi:choline dehydrogenase-like flavoprotein
MAKKMKTEYVVVGSGAGGGTIAYELAKRGKKVLVLERGPDIRWIGNHLFGMAVLDKHGFLTSKEGMGVARALCVGGSSVITCGTSAPPPKGVFEKQGIELAPYLAEGEKDLRVTTLPDETIGEAVMSLMDAGNRLGMKWQKLEKFIDPAKCEPRFCNCMLGCPKDAKWSSWEYLDQAKTLGAEIMANVKVNEVTIAGGEATGVKAWQRGKGDLEVEADVVILAGGGMGTPVIMQNSGIYGAGVGFFCDPLAFTIGYHPTLKAGFAPPMTVGTFDFWDSDGFLLSPVVDPWVSMALEMVKAKPTRLIHWPEYPKSMGIMTKAKDELAGRINIDETFSKQLTHKDQSVLDKGGSLARKVLIEAGCNPSSIWTTKARGAHPGGTVRIGEVLDSNLQSEVKGLFVCDASVIPNSLAAPVVLTLVALGKRLADYLVPQATAAAAAAPAKEKTKAAK